MIHASPDRTQLFISATYIAESASVVFTRGNLERLAVPIGWFRNAASSAVLVPDAVEMVDGGQTVRLGEFEAAAAAILYEFDAEHRRLANQQSIAEYASLGASIHRLRLQKGVARDDFAGVTGKAIARIVRNEVLKLRAKTLQQIAHRLGVKVDALDTFEATRSLCPQYTRVNRA